MIKLTKLFTSCVPLALPMLMFCSSPASAEYEFEVVNPPGAVFARAFGINNAGTVTGGAIDAINAFGFQYDMNTGNYTTIGDGFIPIEISNTGLMVGYVDNECAIRDKKGEITLFYPPSFGAGSFCSARGVNSNGKISGFEIDAGGGWLGFIYDSKHGTYEEFLPSLETIAHAVNAQGQNVGSVFLFENEAYEGSPPGRYGYLRQADGLVKYFAVGQSFPGETYARGISESGMIAGFYLDPDTFEFKSYVTSLSSRTEFEDVTLADDEVLHQSPCNADTPSPGPGYELFFTDVFASQIRNDGVVVGTCGDLYVNPVTGDFIYYDFGFVATPMK